MGRYGMPLSILVAALLASSAAPAIAAPAAGAPPAGVGGEWTLWGHEEGRDYFVDAGGPPDANGVVRFRIRQTFRPSASAETLPYQLAIAEFEVDCRGQTVTLAAVSTYDAAGTVQRSERVPDGRRRPEPIHAGSENERIYLRYCPAALRRPVPVQPPPPLVTVAPPSPPPVRMAPSISPPPPPPPPPPSPNAIAERARPIVPLERLFRSRDYPRAAMRAGEEGSVTYRLEVNRTGRVARCTVTRSSGSLSLDMATCRLVSERARFRPARNGMGRRVADIFYGRIIWRLPDEEPPPATAPPAPG
jgi:protein TonB